MSTRTVAGKIDALVEEMAALEELADQVQTDNESDASGPINQLDRRYRTWYAAALTVLPEDLREKFRFEYEGDLFRNRIKHFLKGPRELSNIYSKLDEDTISTLDMSPWQYPFNDTFRGPFTSQKQILLEAYARHGFSSAMLEGLQLLAETTRRLPISFAVLAKEVQKRSGIIVQDEYDVQRILHAFAVLLFEEVEDEDPTPKKAGASSRLDFLLRRERIAVETKMVGKNLT
jgi:REase_DpnII-MboI